jgi:hypothetical protein
LVNCAVSGHSQRVIAKGCGTNTGSKKHGLWGVYAFGYYAYGLAVIVVHKQPGRSALYWQAARHKHYFAAV